MVTSNELGLKIILNNRLQIILAIISKFGVVTITDVAYDDNDNVFLNEYINHFSTKERLR